MRVIAKELVINDESRKELAAIIDLAFNQEIYQDIAEEVIEDEAAVNDLVELIRLDGAGENEGAGEDLSADEDEADAVGHVIEVDDEFFDYMVNVKVNTDVSFLSFVASLVEFIQKMDEDDDMVSRVIFLYKRGVLSK